MIVISVQDFDLEEGVARFIVGVRNFQLQIVQVFTLEIQIAHESNHALVLIDGEASVLITFLDGVTKLSNAQFVRIERFDFLDDATAACVF